MYAIRSYYDPGDDVGTAHAETLQRVTDQGRIKKAPDRNPGLESASLRHRSVGTACLEGRHARHSQLTAQA